LSNRGRRNTKPSPAFREVNVEAGQSGWWHRRTTRPDERALQGKKPHERRLTRPVGSRRSGPVPASVQVSPAMSEMFDREESSSDIARNGGRNVVVDSRRLGTKRGAVPDDAAGCRFRSRMRKRLKPMRPQAPVGDRLATHISRPREPAAR
jgi:hypothetical protein